MVPGYAELAASSQGADIPLAARFVAVADVYDALRSRRPAQTSGLTSIMPTGRSPAFPGAPLECRALAKRDPGRNNR